MRKIVLTLLLAAAVAACSTSTADQARPATAPAAAHPTITAEPSPTERTAAWWAQVEPDATRFSDHNGQVAELFADPYGVLADPAAASALLNQLQDDVATLQAHGPVPIHSVDIPWGKALAAYAKGYRLAQLGVDATDPGALSAGAEFIAEGSAHLDDATKALAAYTASA